MMFMYLFRFLFPLFILFSALPTLGSALEEEAKEEDFFSQLVSQAIALKDSLDSENLNNYARSFMESVKGTDLGDLEAERIEMVAGNLVKEIDSGDLDIDRFNFYAYSFASAMMGEAPLGCSGGIVTHYHESKMWLQTYEDAMSLFEKNEKMNSWTYCENEKENFERSVFHSQQFSISCLPFAAMDPEYPVATFLDAFQEGIYLLGLPLLPENCSFDGCKCPGNFLLFARHEMSHLWTLLKGLNEQDCAQRISEAQDLIRTVRSKSSSFPSKKRNQVDIVLFLLTHEFPAFEKTGVDVGENSNTLPKLLERSLEEIRDLFEEENYEEDDILFINNHISFLESAVGPIAGQGIEKYKNAVQAYKDLFTAFENWISEK